MKMPNSAGSSPRLAGTSAYFDVWAKCWRAVSAASFVYIASVDLIPSLHQDVKRGASLRQIILLLAGIATIAGLAMA